MALVPVHPPLALQDETFVEVQARVTDAPELTVIGPLELFALISTAGIGAGVGELPGGGGSGTGGGGGGR